MAKGWRLDNRRRIERFLCKVKTGDECWEWQGWIDWGGYGRYKWDRKNCIAHRLMYSLCYGDFDPSLDVCHHCDNRKCVNPNHLFLRTRRDNINDMVQKGRQRGAKGQSNANAKLSPVIIEEIRRLSRDGLSQPKIGKIFGICHSTVGRIVHGNTWTHIGRG